MIVSYIITALYTFSPASHSLLISIKFKSISITGKKFIGILLIGVFGAKLVNFIINHDQHGFQAGRSCLTRLLPHVEDIMCDLNADENADILYLDFSKAFDKVDHAMLLKKLDLYGIQGKGHWLSNFLHGRTQNVVIDGVEYKIIRVLSGVSLGTVLGTLLFILYINSLFSVIKHIKVKVFADDSKLHQEHQLPIGRQACPKKQNLSYWDRLKRLDLYSLQRRRKRYIVILVWKIYYGVIPNNVSIKYSSINTMRFHSEFRIQNTLLIPGGKFF